MTSRLLLVLRVAAWLGAAAGAFWLFGGVRTTQFGPSLRLYTLGLLLLVPFLALALASLLGLGRRRLLWGAALWLALVLLATEGFSRVQELAFQRRYADLPAAADAVVERRWWPFRGHVLIYVPERREWSSDC